MRADINSIWQPCISGGDAVSHSFRMDCKAGKLEVEMPICPGAGDGPTSVKQKHTIPRLAAIATFSRNLDSVNELGQLNLAQGKSTVIANVAEFGGSRMFSRCDTPQHWFLTRSGTEALPRGAEALLIVVADLETQFHIRKSSQQATMISDLQVYPTLYPLDSAEKKGYAEAVQATKVDPSVERLDQLLRPYIELQSDVLPILLESKLKHFMNRVLPLGITAPNDFESWVQPAIISDTYSTDVLRWELCGQAIQILNQLQVSGKHPSRSAEMLQVYSHFMAEHNELIKLVGSRVSERITSKPLELEMGQSGITSPFMDRQAAFDRILGLSPGVRQTVKTLFAVRWNCIVLRTGFLAKWAPAGEAEVGSAGAQPAKE